MIWKRKLCLGLMIWPGSIIVLVGGFALYNWATGKAANEATMEAWEAAGHPTEFSGFNPPPLKPDQEYFSQNRYLQAVTQFDTDPAEPLGPVIYRNPQLRERFVSALDLPPQVKSTLKSSLRDQTQTDFVAVADAFEAEAPHVDSVEKVRLALEPQDDLFAGLADAARLPAGHFGPRYDVTDIATVQIPHYSTWIHLATMTSLRSRVALAQGRSAQAYEELGVTFRILETMEADPVLLSLMVRYAITQSLLNTIWEGLAQEAWRDEELEGLETELARLDPVREFIRATQGEAALMQQAEKTKLTAEQIRQVYGNEVPVWMLHFPGVSQHNVANYFDYLQRFCLEPALDQDWEAYLDGVRSIEAIGDRNIRQLAARTLLPTYQVTYRSQLDQQGYIFMARTAIALELYKFQQGQYPADLEALAPDFLPSLFTSPADGSPMSYQPLGERYELRFQEPAGNETLPVSRNDYLVWIWRYTPLIP